MADVKCHLGSLVTAGLPAAVAVMSIWQAGSCAARSDGYKTMDTQRRENSAKPTGVSKGRLEGSSDPQAGLQEQV